ncbi:hypothetical protein D3C77_469420 [compost metagenome]
MPKPSISSEMTKKGNRDGNNTSHQMESPMTPASHEALGYVSIRMPNAAMASSRSSIANRVLFMRNASTIFIVECMTLLGQTAQKNKESDYKIYCIFEAIMLE